MQSESSTRRKGFDFRLSRKIFIVQSFNWNNEQATRYPFTLYYKNLVSSLLQQLVFAFISNQMQHDTIAFQQNFNKYFLTKSVIFYKKMIPFIKKLIYFIDGCGVQYKNFENFENYKYHCQGFSLKTDWHFFATSHCKTSWHWWQNQKTSCQWRPLKNH